MPVLSLRYELKDFTYEEIEKIRELVNDGNNTNQIVNDILHLMIMEKLHQHVTDGDYRWMKGRSRQS